MQFQLKGQTEATCTMLLTDMNMFVTPKQRQVKINPDTAPQWELLRFASRALGNINQTLSLEYLSLLEECRLLHLPVKLVVHLMPRTSHSEDFSILCSAGVITSLAKEFQLPFSLLPHHKA